MKITNEILEAYLNCKTKGVDSRKEFAFCGIGCYYVLPLTSSTYPPAVRRQ